MEEIDIDRENLLLLLKTVFDNLADGFAILSLTGKILVVNKALLKIGGMTQEELVGKDVLKLINIFPPESLKRIALSFMDAAKGMPSDHYILHANDKSGQLKTLELTNSLIEDCGKKVAIAVIMRDITDEIENKNKIFEAKEKITELEKKIIDLESKTKKK